MERSTTHLAKSVAFLPPAYFSVFPSSCNSFHVNVGSHKQMTEFVGDKRFGLIYKDQWRFESNTTIKGRKN